MRLVVAVVVLCLVSAYNAADVTIDPTQERHLISDLIYGMNFASDAQVTAGGVTMNRWGGNSVTSYNYLNDVSSRGLDYFFEKIPGCWNDDDNYCQNPPSDPKASSGANKFLTQVANQGVSTFFTVPTIGWVPAYAKYSQPLPCSFPTSQFAVQDCTDPYNTGCGSGTNGPNDPPACNPAQQDYPITFPFTANKTFTSMSVDPTWVKTWIEYIVSIYGPSNGKRIYQLDNEPNLWSSTHNDIHPEALTYDELWNRMRDYAVAILEADPTAEIAGPAEWGWINYYCSDYDIKNNGGICNEAAPDRAAHDGTPLLAWILQQAADYENSNGKRILHYLDIHYYPAGGSGPENVQSLWNPSYPDPSYIATNISLLNRLHEWGEIYPGTKFSISEYDWYDHDSAAGAVTYAEVLGYFGKYGLAAATAWSPPSTTDIAFAAFKLYRNYDGDGGFFYPTSIKADSSDDTLRAFASVGSSELTTVLINEDPSNSVTVTVTFGNFDVTGTMAVWYASNGANSNLDKQSDLSVAADDSVTITIAASSINMLVVTGIPGPGGGPIDTGGSTSSASSLQAFAILQPFLSVFC